MRSLRAQSLLSLAPIATLVERELQPERVRASGIALRMGTVSLEAGELRYVTETGELVDRHDRSIGQPAVELAEGVLASASIPLAFPPVVLNDEHYVDGGAREILPLELPGGAHGRAAGGGGVGQLRHHQAGPLLRRSQHARHLRRVSAEIGPNETLRKELDPPGGWRPEVRLVAPRFNVHDSMTIDPALIAISLDHGYLRAADVLLRARARGLRPHRAHHPHPRAAPPPVRPGRPPSSTPRSAATASSSPSPRTGGPTTPTRWVKPGAPAPTSVGRAGTRKSPSTTTNPRLGGPARPPSRWCDPPGPSPPRVGPFWPRS